MKARIRKPGSPNSGSHLFSVFPIIPYLVHINFPFFTFLLLSIFPSLLFVYFFYGILRHWPCGLHFRYVYIDVERQKIGSSNDIY